MTIDTRIILFMMVAILVVPSPSKAMKSRKLDDTTPGNDEIKCGSCPCGTTCYASPPPPKPSPPPPPKKPSCPPPPCTLTPCGGGGGSGRAPPNYIYITGPPGDLYPVVQSVSDAQRRFGAAPMFVVVFALVGMLAFL